MLNGNLENPSHNIRLDSCNGSGEPVANDRTVAFDGKRSAAKTSIRSAPLISGGHASASSNVEMKAASSIHPALFTRLANTVSHIEAPSSAPSNSMRRISWSDSNKRRTEFCTRRISQYRCASTRTSSWHIAGRTIPDTTALRNSTKVFPGDGGNIAMVFWIAVSSSFSRLSITASTCRGKAGVPCVRPWAPPHARAACGGAPGVANLLLLGKCVVRPIPSLAVADSNWLGVSGGSDGANLHEGSKLGAVQMR
mmetsp:Transcript_49397/g.142048  ORF Transcript_49397/g.142048 Transcript_49397/m.142048 type:complete len:253 (+) Transcript_49397:1277-2035(+)